MASAGYMLTNPGRALNSRTPSRPFGWGGAVFARKRVIMVTLWLRYGHHQHSLPRESMRQLVDWIRGHRIVSIVIVCLLIGGIGAAAGLGKKPARTTSATPAGSSSTAPTPVAAAQPAAPTDSAPPADDSNSLPGSPGTPCHMAYAARGNQTVMRFWFARPGEIITHLDGAGPGINRHDDHVPAGYTTYVYDVPFGQITDMGAVFYAPDASGQSWACAYAPGTSVAG
jgi:hypothetical protein